MIERLDFVAVPSQDSERSRSFYVETLGLKEDEHSRDARTGMRELGVRACLLRAALGDQRSLDSAAALVGEVEKPALRERVQGLRVTVPA